MAIVSWIVRNRPGSCPRYGEHGHAGRNSVCLLSQRRQGWPHWWGILDGSFRKKITACGLAGQLHLGSYVALYPYLRWKTQIFGFYLCRQSIKNWKAVLACNGYPQLSPHAALLATHKGVWRGPRLVHTFRERSRMLHCQGSTKCDRSF